jgi:putative membrane protein
MKLDQLGDALLTTAAFAALGVLVFTVAFWLMVKVSPFSVRKEIEDDQNTSLAILMGSVIIGLALVIAAAVHG